MSKGWQQEAAQNGFSTLGLGQDVRDPSHLKTFEMEGARLPPLGELKGTGQEEH